jgi:hypothetical protein
VTTEHLNRTDSALQFQTHPKYPTPKKVNDPVGALNRRIKRGVRGSHIRVADSINKLEKGQKSIQRQIRRLDGQMSDFNDSTQTDMQTLRTNADAFHQKIDIEIQALMDKTEAIEASTQFQADPDNTDAQIDALTKEENSQIEALTNDHNAQIEAFRNESNERIEAFRNECSERIEALRNECSEQIEALRKEQNAQIQALRLEIDTKIQVLATKSDEQAHALGDNIRDIEETLQSSIQEAVRSKKQASADRCLACLAAIFDCLLGMCAANAQVAANAQLAQQLAEVRAALLAPTDE